MSRSDLIHNYLTDLQVYLSRVSEAQAQEVVKEIESHIYDSLDIEENTGDAAIETILGRLGSPRDLAVGYIGHITQGDSPPKGLKPISLMRKGISQSLYYSVVWGGYVLGGSLVLLALLNLFMPSSFGVWIAEHGNSIILSFNSGELGANKVPSSVAVSIFVVSGVTLLYVTTKISRVLKLYINRGSL